jgi:hypothetical protein
MSCYLSYAYSYCHLSIAYTASQVILYPAWVT